MVLLSIIPPIPFAYRDRQPDRSNASTQAEKENGSEFVQYYVYLSLNECYLKLPKQPLVALFSLL